MGVEVMEQKNKFIEELKILTINNIDFTCWNNIYNQFINMSQCGRFSFQEINDYINILLSSSVIYNNVNEEKIIILQKYKLEIIKEKNPSKDNDKNNLIRRIKEYKECIASNYLNIIPVTQSIYLR